MIAHRKVAGGAAELTPPKARKPAAPAPGLSGNGRLEPWAEEETKAPWVTAEKRQ